MKRRRKHQVSEGKRKTKARPGVAVFVIYRVLSSATLSVFQTGIMKRAAVALLAA